MNPHPRIKAYSCPCCQGFIGEAAPIEMVIDRYSGSSRHVLEALSTRIGRFVSSEALLSAMYDQRADGGPDSARSVLHVTINRLRKQLAAYGWSIVSTIGGRGNDTSYRLIPTGEM